MIKLIDAEKNPFWINPNNIDLIEFHPGYKHVELYYHIGASCQYKVMAESADDVKKMIDEAIKNE